MGDNNIIFFNFQHFSKKERFEVWDFLLLWFERCVSFAMRRLFVHPIRYDPKRRKPPHSKYVPFHLESKGQSRYYVNKNPLYGVRSPAPLCFALKGTSQAGCCSTEDSLLEMCEQEFCKISGRLGASEIPGAGIRICKQNFDTGFEMLCGFLKIGFLMTLAEPVKQHAGRKK